MTTRNLTYLIVYITLTVLLLGVVLPFLISSRDYILPVVGYVTGVAWLIATYHVATRLLNKSN